MNTKVYIVHECVDGEDRIAGVYSTYEKARVEIDALVEYAGFEHVDGNPPDYFSYGEDYICIEVYGVQ